MYVVLTFVPIISKTDDQISGSVILLMCPFLTIDYAMGMIYPTDDNPVTIHLVNGTYSPSNNGDIFPINMFSNINLIGQDEEATILHAESSEENQRRVIILNNCQNNIISDLTIMGGLAEGDCPDCYGGGMYLYNSNPRLTNMTIENNTG